MKLQKIEISITETIETKSINIEVTETETKTEIETESLISTSTISTGLFKIFSKDDKSSISFYCEENEFSGVKKIVDMVRNDAKLATGALPEFNYSIIITIAEETAEETAIIFGTIGKSNLFNEINSSPIKDKYECYIF